MLRADRILPHHRFKPSLGFQAARVRGTIVKVFPSPGFHNGANHQHFLVTISEVIYFAGADIDINGQTVFVAVRFGDDEGLDVPIPNLRENTPIELKGEYIPSGEAYPTEDNNNPVRPVIHFTHHPYGYVFYDNEYYS